MSLRFAALANSRSDAFAPAATPALRSFTEPCTNRDTANAARPAGDVEFERGVSDRSNCLPPAGVIIAAADSPTTNPLVNPASAAIHGCRRRPSQRSRSLQNPARAFRASAWIAAAISASSFSKDFIAPFAAPSLADCFGQADKHYRRVNKNPSPKPIPATMSIELSGCFRIRFSSVPRISPAFDQPCSMYCEAVS